MRSWQALFWAPGLGLLCWRCLFGIVRFSDDATTMMILKWPPQFAFEFVGLPPHAAILHSDENDMPGESFWLLLADAWPVPLATLLIAELVKRGFGISAKRAS